LGTSLVGGLARHGDVATFPLTPFGIVVVGQTPVPHQLFSAWKTTVEVPLLTPQPPFPTTELFAILAVPSEETLIPSPTLRAKVLFVTARL
jgi:hypothetical protein